MKQAGGTNPNSSCRLWRHLETMKNGIGRRVGSTHPTWLTYKCAIFGDGVSWRQACARPGIYAGYWSGCLPPQFCPAAFGGGAKLGGILRSAFSPGINAGPSATHRRRVEPTIQTQVLSCELKVPSSRSTAGVVGCAPLREAPPTLHGLPHFGEDILCRSMITSATSAFW